MTKKLFMFKLALHTLTSHYLHWNGNSILKSYRNPFSFSMLKCMFDFYGEFRSPYTVNISIDKHEQDISLMMVQLQGNIRNVLQRHGSSIKPQKF